MSEVERVAGSFRDPSGAVFREGGVLYRGVDASYMPEFEAAEKAGLFEDLIQAGLLIPHEKLSETREGFAAVIEPVEVPFVSYPYEWCFSQLKHAALCTLEIQRRALEKGFVLKDASAYNVQFLKGKPVFIDTLSFERYEEGKPWIAYRQFCQQFLAPVLLMAQVDVRLGQLSRLFVDGVPLDLASRLLPKRTRWSPWIQAHIHMHARMQAGSGGQASALRSAKLSKAGLLGLVDNLRNLVESQEWRPGKTTWSDYYSETNYTDAAMEFKKRLVAEFLGRVEPRPKMVWDLGANTGVFSRIAASLGAEVVAFDLDPAAVEAGYLQLKGGSILPLVLDLSNPSPSQGWAHEERESLAARGPADVVMALALVHHLAIGNNVPLPEVARFFAKCGRWLIVEFVPKEDSQVRRMLAIRADVFPDYVLDGFEKAFEGPFEFVESKPVEGTSRTLHLLKRRRGDNE